MAKAGKGRPTAYTKELGDLICDRLADGMTLLEVCRMPDVGVMDSTVRRWAQDVDSPFSAQYAKAREIGYLKMADELLAIADDGCNDTYETEDGREVTNADVIARSRLRVDTRKWLLSKALPKIYGDKLELGGKDGGPVQAVIQIVSGVPRTE